MVRCGTDEPSAGDDASPPQERTELKLELRLQNEELQRTLAALDAARRRYVQLFEQAPIGYVVVDEVGRVREVNRAALELLGVAASEIIATNLASHVPAEVCDALYRDRQRARASRQRCACELELPLGGRDRALHVETSIIDQGGEIYLTALVDVSALRQMERDLAHAQRMEALGRLASGVAHDFNNLLMGLGGCADMALAQLPEDASARMYLNEIRRATSDGATIARQLLGLARSEESEEKLTALDQAVTHAVGVLRHLVGENIEVVSNLGAPGAHVLLPPGRIEQIMLNLGANARDAMPSGGTLTITTMPVSQQMRPPAGPAGDCVLLQVSDTGVGMETPVRARALEPFFTTKPSGRGTGLGLSAVSRIVEQAGGLLRLDSSVDVGTSARIYLPSGPATPEAAPSPTPLPRARTATDGATILLTEDDAMVRMVVRYYLENAGFRVLEARSGEEALACMDRFPGVIHLLLTDLLLPGLGGADLAMAITSRRPELPVLYMSAHAAAHAQPTGAILKKPFTCAQLLDVVTTALDGP